MVETEFENIAKKEGGTLTIKDEKISGGNGAVIPNLVFILKFNYKGRLISIDNRTGASTIGRISCDMSKQKDSLVFEMITRSHFLSLFYKKNRFKLNSKNINIEYFMRNSIGINKLKEIANDTLFEPTILGKNTEETYSLVIEYSTQFSNWHQVIQPIIIFYKEFIDRFGD